MSFKGRKCVICSKREYNSKENIFFSRFPSQESRCKEWIKVVGNPELVFVPIERLCQIRHVCGDHFDKRCFNRKINRLKKNAIPTLKLSSPPLTDEQLKEFPFHVASYTPDAPADSTGSSQNVRNTISDVSNLDTTRRIPTKDRYWCKNWTRSEEESQNITTAKKRKYNESKDSGNKMTQSVEQDDRKEKRKIVMQVVPSGEKVPGPMFEIGPVADLNSTMNSSGLDNLSNDEDDGFQDNISVAETNIMDVEIMDYDDHVETLPSTNSIPMPAVATFNNRQTNKFVLEINGALDSKVEEIQFSSTSSKLKASIDFHNYCETQQTNMCRLCCRLRDNNNSFYNIYTDNISKLMDQCLHITATKDDRLPSYICQDCYDNLKKTHSFYSSVHEVDTILKSKVGENTCPSNNIRDKVSTAQDNDKLITAQDNDKLIINFEINKEQSQFHCPFCKYGYRNKSCIIKHINQFHFQTTASDNEMEETHRDTSNIQTQSLNNNTSLSTYTTVPVPLHPHITHSDLSNDEQLFIDLNVSDLITFNKKHSEKYLTESYDSTYNIPGVSDYCDVTCEETTCEDDNVVTSETVDPSLFTDFIIEESIDGYKCKHSRCDRVFKSLVWSTLHECIDHKKYILVYKCLKCRQVYPDKLQISDHLTNAHQIESDNFSSHIIPANVKCLFSCEHCGYFYTTRNDVQKHKEKCSPYKNDKIKCVCGEEFRGCWAYRRHCAAQHGHIKKPKCKIFYECSLCDVIFCTQGNCFHHGQKQHRGEKSLAHKYNYPLHKLKVEK